jgi:hypothetical protein
MAQRMTGTAAQALAAIAVMREVPLGGNSGIDIARERATTHNQGATP